MLESEWETATSCGALIAAIQRKSRDFVRRNRVLRLFTIHVLRAFPPDGLPVSFAAALDEVERFLTEGTPRTAAVAAIEHACAGYEHIPPYSRIPSERAISGLQRVFDQEPANTANTILGGYAELTRKEDGFDAYVARTARFAPLLREFFCNPFRPVEFDPAWRTSTAIGLAQTMYDARHFNAMPILADALQDAGCEDEQILTHCRDESAVHICGCWVVDLVLAKQ